MSNKDEMIHSLSQMEMDILIELKDQDAVLSFNNKGMVEVDNPHKGITFFELGKKVINSLEKKELIVLKEKGIMHGGEKYTLTESGRNIADSL